MAMYISLTCYRQGYGIIFTVRPQHKRDLNFRMFEWKKRATTRQNCRRRRDFGAINMPWCQSFRKSVAGKSKCLGHNASCYLQAFFHHTKISAVMKLFLILCRDHPGEVARRQARCIDLSLGHLFFIATHMPVSSLKPVSKLKECTSRWSWKELKRIQSFPKWL